ncbi:MAG: hypothetical protein RIB58_04330 [Phycisphaerales bacterium]
MKSTRKPKRWYRPRNVFLGTLLIALGLIGSQVHFALTARPGKARNVNPELERLVAEHAPWGNEPGNAWETLARIDTVVDEIDLALKESLYDREWVIGDDGKPTLSEYAAERYRMLAESEFDELIAEYARAPAFGPIFERGVLFNDHELNKLGSMRRAVDALRLQMSVATHRGAEVEGVIDRFEIILILAHRTAARPDMLSYLCALSVVDVAMTQMAAALINYELDTAQFAAIRAAMTENLPLPSPVMAVEYERLTFHQLVDLMHTDDGDGDGRFLPSELNTHTESGHGRLANLLHHAVMSKAEALNQGDACFDVVREIMTSPRSERPALQAKLERIRNGGERPNPVLAGLTYDYSKAARAIDGSLTLIRGLRIMVAIEEFAAAHGSYPNRLEELVPAHLSEVPDDPFSEAAFGYRRLDAQDPATGATGYLLWSAGADGANDNGVPPTVLSVDDDGVARQKVRSTKALKDGHAGTDFIINLPRQYDR